MAITLVGNIDKSTHMLTASGPIVAKAGDHFLIGTEVMEFLGHQTPIDPTATTAVKTAKAIMVRGAEDSVAAPHLNGAAITGPFGLDELDVLTLKIGGVSATTSVATQTVQTEERTFVETANGGTYTGTVVVPVGATVLDVIWRNTALWTASVSASVVVGDGDDPDGYIAATDLKAAPLADVLGARYGFSSKETLGATIGVYKGGAGKYCAAQKTITATVTTVDAGAGTAGRSRLLVVYATPTSVEASKA